MAPHLAAEISFIFMDIEECGKEFSQFTDPECLQARLSPEV